jgi:AAA family ATP:ADP antiporter
MIGWISYVTIESFGSMVVQCYWALVNVSVDVNFAKKNYGFIVAGENNIGLNRLINRLGNR